MAFRKSRVWLAAAAFALPLAAGETAPDLVLRDRSGNEVRLSAYLQKKHVVLLAPAAGTVLAPALLEDAARRLDALDTVVLLPARDTEAGRKLLGNIPSATVLIDTAGVVRRMLPGRVLTGPDLAAFVEQWQSGQAVFRATCARCHGEDGALDICGDVKPLAGIGKRLTEAQIRERLRIGEVNDREVLVRGQLFNRQEVDVVIAYVAGL